MHNKPIPLRYRPEELQYVIYSDDVEELLADYASSHNLSEAFQKELERFVWQFFEFTKTRKLKSGVKIKAPQKREEYVVSREVLIRYVSALFEAGYSSSSIAKRLQTVILVLRRLGVPEVWIDVLRRPMKEVNVARKIEQEENTPILTLDDAREFFRRLELLFKLKRLPKKRYIKAIAFSLLLFATGRRVSEIVQIKVQDIDFESHAIRIPANQTKEGKLLKLSAGERIVFMTHEAEMVLMYYLKANKDEIQRQQGYLFMTPNKRSLKDTFLHKIVKMSRTLVDEEANLDFVVSDGIHKFKLKYFRKLFIQEWERQTEKRGMMNDRVLVAARKITGHRPANDVHRINYAKLSLLEVWGYYKELYYNLSVLTEEQRKMLGIMCKKERQVKKNNRRQHHEVKTLDFLSIPQRYQQIPVDANFSSRITVMN
ncbi:tyrosine-type recombinase/integrase [Thermococcus barophilus]|uniref:Tyr recombinase domain-containing protein n=1 Tax=Thermococcus barophilus TaxID=55802 RepID=A0A0S1XE29_THEBA|nr:site-specific integrase [Thermococcus barophilus]ALM76059.1 hypothetical protein TBCH5v1_2158 [Thermococcus barophilus]